MSTYGMSAPGFAYISARHMPTCEHANAAVLELSLTEPPHVDNVGESKGVEADVTNVGACFESAGGVRTIQFSLSSRTRKKK